MKVAFSAQILALVLMSYLSASVCQQGSPRADNEQRLGYDPNNPPLPYSFHYAILSPNEGDFKSHTETREGGNVVGEYSIAQPDGCVRHIRYRATWQEGFVPEITYSGNCDPSFYMAPEPVAAVPTETVTSTRMNSQLDASVAAPLGDASTSYPANSDVQTVPPHLQHEMPGRYRRLAVYSRPI